MKIKDLLTFIPAVIIVLLMFLPVPPVLIKVLYLLDCIFCAALLVIGFISAFKKMVPKRLAVLIMYFALLNLAMIIGTTRFVLLMSPSQENVVLVSAMRDIAF